jgi:hypothetical protein
MMCSVREIGVADYLPGIIDPECAAVVATQGADVGQDTAVPNESMVGEITFEVGKPYYLTSVV